MSSWWKPKKVFEQRRLGCSDGWTLDSSTASSISSSPGRTLRPRKDPSNNAMMSPLTVPDSGVKKRPSSAETTFDDDGGPPASKKKAIGPPPVCRVLVETEMLCNMMESHIFCPQCNAAVVVSFPTVCIASGCRIDCSNAMCGYVHLRNPKGANVALPATAGSPFIVRSTDYATNILFVLSFISSGDGGKEAERLLGLLGLHNSTSMEKRSFGIIESRLSPIIEELNREILLEGKQRYFLKKNS